MIDREKLMTGLEHCARSECITQDITCPYWGKECREVMAQDAFAALREDADEIDDLRNQVHNLTLYLQWLEMHDALRLREMMREFDGMPGYIGVSVDKL